MKKLLSVLLCAAMIVCGLTFAVSADKPVDKAMLLDDISVEDTSLTGSMGYIVNSHYLNEYDVKAWGSETESWAVEDPNGISVAFDLNVIAISQCTHLVNESAPKDFKHVQGLVFTFSNYDGYQAIIYDALKQEFQIANVAWPTSVVAVNGSHIIESAPFTMKPGEWHRCFFSILGTEVYVYCDGELIISHDFDGGPGDCLSRSFLMFWESHVRLMMDNLIVGTDEYDDTLGDTFEEKIAANYNEEEGIKNVLFSNDFNNAVEVEYDFEETVPVWEYEKDDNGKEIEYPAFEEDGVTPKLDERGRQMKEKHILLDEKGNKVQATDDKGNLLFEPLYHFIVDGVKTEDDGVEYAGFTFGRGIRNTMNIPCRPVDKETYCGMLKDVKNAVISFSDTGASEGQTFNVEISIDPKNASFTSAQDLIISIDPIFNFKGFENVASGAKVTADSKGEKVNITLPSGFKGKLCDLVLEVPAGTEMAQSSKYRVGFLAGSSTTFKNGSDVVANDKITIDGGFVSTTNFIKGDANGDGKVNAKDVTLMMKYIVDKDKENGDAAKKLKSKAADVYTDNKINARDVNVLMKFIVFGEWK